MEVLAAFLLFASLPEVRSARDCDEVFGDELATLENHAARESRLNFIIDSDTDVVVDHSYSWKIATQAEIGSLELVETSTDGSTAYISFLASHEGIDCDDGVYAISVDDSIGPDGRVLAVLRRALLIEMDGRLCYLVPEGGELPRFRITWSSRFGMRRPSRTQPLSTKPGRRRN